MAWRWWYKQCSLRFLFQNLMEPPIRSTPWYAPSSAAAPTRALSKSASSQTELFKATEVTRRTAYPVRLVTSAAAFAHRSRNDMIILDLIYRKTQPSKTLKLEARFRDFNRLGLSFKKGLVCSAIIQHEKSDRASMV
jgi:hypothetical protein